MIASIQWLKYYRSTNPCLRYCKPDFYWVHQKIQPPTINSDRVLDRSKDRPCISLASACYMFPEKNKIKKQVSKLKIIIITCKNCLNPTYHALSSSAIHELSQPFLTIITLHVILYKKASFVLVHVQEP